MTSPRILARDTPSRENSPPSGESTDNLNRVPWLRTRLSNGWDSPTYAQVASRSPSPVLAPKPASAPAEVSDEEEKGDLTPFSDCPATLTLTTDDKGDKVDASHLSTPRSSPPGTPPAPSRTQRTATRSSARTTIESDSPSDQALARRQNKGKTPARTPMLPALATTPRNAKKNKQAAKQAISDARKRKRMEADVGGGLDPDEEHREPQLIGRGLDQQADRYATRRLKRPTYPNNTWIDHRARRRPT